MRGRAKADRERAIILAHQIEAMARQKTLRRLEAYLPREKPQTDNGGMEVLAMLKRMKALQDQRNIK